MATKMLRGNRGKSDINPVNDAPQRWFDYHAYKNMMTALNNSYTLVDLDKYYKEINDLRQKRPALDAVKVSDTTIKLSNRGLADQVARSSAITYKMKVFRMAEILRGTMSIFKKTVQYEDAAWLKRHYTAGEAKLVSEMACLDVITELVELDTFIGYVDILVDDIDKAGRIHQNSMYALSRETIPEKFGGGNR